MTATKKQRLFACILRNASVLGYSVDKTVSLKFANAPVLTKACSNLLWPRWTFDFSVIRPKQGFQLMCTLLTYVSKGSGMLLSRCNIDDTSQRPMQVPRGHRPVVRTPRFVYAEDFF